MVLLGMAQIGLDPFQQPAMKNVLIMLVFMTKFDVSLKRFKRQIALEINFCQLVFGMCYTGAIAIGRTIFCTLSCGRQ